MNFLKRLLLAGILILVIACGGDSRQREAPIVSFQDAAAHAELRDVFLMQLVGHVGQLPYVTVSYDDTPEEFQFLQTAYGFQARSGIAMVTNWQLPRLGDLGKRQIPVRISVFPEAFSRGSIETEEDFLSSMLHELEHARTLQTGRIGRFSILPTFLTKEGKLNEDFARSVMELEALRNEIARQKLSEGYFQSRANLYVEHYLELWEYGKEAEGGLAADLKVEFFHRGMLTFPAFFREYQPQGEIWYFRHPSGKPHFFSPDEIRRIKEKHRIAQGESPAFLFAASS